MKRPLASGSRLAIAVAAVAAALAPGGAVAAVNDDPTFLQVVTNNVENLPEPGREADGDNVCSGQWRNLPRFLGGFVPDVFLVQQIDPRRRAKGQPSQLERYQAELKGSTGQTYGSVVSSSNPRDYPPAHCRPYKAFQANAILFRRDRLDVAKGTKGTWQARGSNGAKCVSADTARTRNVYVSLLDKKNGRSITAESIHWPTDAAGGHPCAKQNASLSRYYATRRGGDALHIFGGDANFTPFAKFPQPRAWYSQTLAHWADPVLNMCSRSPDGRACLARNGTGAGDEPSVRRDFIFARSASRTPAAAYGGAIPYGVAGSPPYSQHRAVYAFIRYGP